MQLTMCARQYKKLWKKREKDGGLDFSRILISEIVCLGSNF